MQSKKEISSVTLKEVIEVTRKRKYGFSSQMFWFVFLTMLSLCLAYLLPLSLIVTFPIVIIPSYFAFTSINAIRATKNDPGIKFFTMYKAYFSQLFFGGYRLWFGLLKSFLTYFVSSSIALAIYLNFNSEYKAIIENAVNTSDFETATNELYEFLSKAQSEKTIFLITSITLLLAAFVFVHHIFRHSLKTRRNLFTKNVFPTSQYAFVDRQVRKNNRKFFFKSYISCAWFVQLLLVIAGAGGIVISFFLLKGIDPYQAVTISLFLMLLVLMPFLNHITTMEELMFERLLETYESTFVRVTLEFLTKYKEKLGMQEEDAKKIEELLNMQKKELEEDQSKEDENDKKE